MAFSHVSETIKIFFSFAPVPQDRSLFERLRTHLSNQKHQRLIDLWYDSEISAGNNVDHVIKAHMRAADIIVLLISADFFDSDQCMNVEMRYALEQKLTRAARIIPVLLRPTELRGSHLEQYSLLPQNGKPVSIWNNLDVALTEVAKGIRRVVEEIASQLTGAPTPTHRPQLPLDTIPHRRNPFFTDRTDTLIELHRYFTSEPSIQTRTQALCGLGGIGKTLLAIEYTYLYRHEYQAIFWLNATSSELLSSDMLSLADQLGILSQDNSDEQQRIAAIKAWLRQHDNWLLILDNVEDFAIIHQLIPPLSGGHVLLTTLSQATGQFAHAISVTQMPLHESTLFLLRRAKIIPVQGPQDTASDADYVHARALVQEVEGHTLTLDQAGAYIEETQQTLASYLELYRERQARLLGIRGQLATDHPEPVTTTLALTFEKIAQIHPGALELLRFFAFLQPDALPKAMIRQGASVLHGTLRTLAADPIAFDTTIATLLRFSLVHHHVDTTTLHIPRIVQIVIKKELTKKQQHQLANQAVRLVNDIFPEALFTTWKGCERYLPQAKHCAMLIRIYQLTLKEGPLLLERLGSYCYQRGCYDEAETYLTQALHLQEQQRHVDPLDTAQTLNALGRLSLRQAHYEKAARFHQRALEIRERVLGPDHPNTAESLHNLAVVYEQNGQYQLAEQFYLRVLSCDEHNQGPDHLETAKTLNNLGLIYYLQDNYPLAETTYQRALTIYEQTLSADDPDITYTLNGLGTLSEKCGHYRQAEEFYQRALDIRTQIFGDEHPETAHSMNILAGIYAAQGQNTQAKELYQHALAIGEQALGPDHPDIALFLNNLALVTNRQGQYQLAEQYYTRALSIYEQTRGDDHLVIARVLTNLGQLARTTKMMEQAKSLLQRALAIREQELGLAHPDTTQSIDKLTDLFIDLQAYEEAASLFQRALASRSQETDATQPATKLMREKYTSLLNNMRRVEESAMLHHTVQDDERESPQRDN